MHNLKHGTDGEDVVSVPLCHMQCVCAIAGNESENNRVFNQLTDNWQRKDDERMGEDAKKKYIYILKWRKSSSQTHSRDAESNFRLKCAHRWNSSPLCRIAERYIYRKFPNSTTKSWLWVCVCADDGVVEQEKLLWNILLLHSRS